ncbi:MAG: single-stranded DNA-binding protein [Hyphomicrobiales bacterium]
MSVNKVILIGRLGVDPEIKSFESGAKVATFRMATTEFYKNKEGQRVEHTEWHSIVMWRNLADICEKYVRKGDQLYVEGRIRTRQWEDKDGNKRYTTEIEGLNMNMLGGKKDSNENPSQAPAAPINDKPEKTNDSPNNSSAEDDDLPF